MSKDKFNIVKIEKLEQRCTLDEETFSPIKQIDIRITWRPELKDDFYWMGAHREYECLLVKELYEKVNDIMFGTHLDIEEIKFKEHST